MPNSSNPAMNFSDPNAHLSDDLIHHGLSAAASAFRCCHLKPWTVEGDAEEGCRSMLTGKLGDKEFLVYVRVTVDDEDEEGTGPLPGVAIDAAASLGAEPHVIRIHIRESGDGLSFSYFGYEEFIAHVRSHKAEWNAHLLAPRTFSDYRRILKDRVSTLRIDFEATSYGDHNWIDFKLQVDLQTPYSGTINPPALLNSVESSDRHFIFTCECGIPPCAGIWRPVLIVHEGAHVLWKAYHARGRRIFLFDREQYRAEILGKCTEAVAFARERNIDWIIPHKEGRKYLEAGLYRATEEVPS